MKTCISCRHYRDDGRYVDGHHANDCENPKNTFTSKADPITGGKYSYQKYSPKVMRRTWYIQSFFEGHCGAAGRWHQEKLVEIAIDDVLKPLKLVD